MSETNEGFKTKERTRSLLLNAGMIRGGEGVVKKAETPAPQRTAPKSATINNTAQLMPPSERKPTLTSDQLQKNLDRYRSLMQKR
jgi:hypothetical protein